MSWRVLLEPDGLENIYCNSVRARDGYCRVQHSILFDGVTGAIVRTTTPGLIVNKISTGLYEVDYSVLAFVDVPYAKAELFDNSVVLSCQGNSLPTTTKVRFTSQTIAAVPVSADCQHMEVFINQ